MKDIKAKPVKVDGKYRIEAVVDGVPLFLGNHVDNTNTFFRYREFNTESEAIAHISGSDRLYYSGDTP
jgi:hypothetical protein